MEEFVNVARTSTDLSYTTLQINLAPIMVPSELKLAGVYGTIVRLAGTPSFALAFYRQIKSNSFKFRLTDESATMQADGLALTGESMDFELVDRSIGQQLAGGTNGRCLLVLRREILLFPDEVYAVAFQHNANGAWKGGVDDSTQHPCFAGPTVAAMGAFPDIINVGQSSGSFGIALATPSFTLRSLKAMRRIGR